MIMYFMSFSSRPGTRSVPLTGDVVADRAIRTANSRMFCPTYAPIVSRQPHRSPDPAGPHSSGAQESAGGLGPCSQRALGGAG